MSELRIERKFAANPETVFAFVTKTENLLKWWGPEGITVLEHELDLSRTGSWSSVMVSDEGQRYKVTGEVLNIDPPRSVEFTWGWHDDDDKRGQNSTVRFELSSDGAGGTDFLLVHSGLADDEVAGNHNMGWTSSLSKLEKFVN